MNFFRSIIPCCVGVAFGVVLVLSCSDDAPTHADAATCDCAAAEPPLVGRIVTVRQNATAAANQGVGPYAACPSGSEVLGGGCFIVGSRVRDVVLKQSTFDAAPANGWVCDYQNNEAAAVEVGAVVRCLTPAP